MKQLTSLHCPVCSIVNRLTETGTHAAECEIYLRRQLRQQQKRLHHLQMLQLMPGWTHGSCDSRSSHSQANASWAQCLQLGLLPHLHRHKLVKACGQHSYFGQHAVIRQLGTLPRHGHGHSNKRRAHTIALKLLGKVAFKA